MAAGCSPSPKKTPLTIKKKKEVNNKFFREEPPSPPPDASAATSALVKLLRDLRLTTAAFDIAVPKSMQPVQSELRGASIKLIFVPPRCDVINPIQLHREGEQSVVRHHRAQLMA